MQAAITLNDSRSRIATTLSTALARYSNADVTMMKKKNITTARIAVATIDFINHPLSVLPPGYTPYVRTGGLAHVYSF